MWPVAAAARQPLQTLISQLLFFALTCCSARSKQYIINIYIYIYIYIHIRFANGENHLDLFFCLFVLDQDDMRDMFRDFVGKRRHYPFQVSGENNV